MKKVLLLAVVIGGVAFTSCSKNECECTALGVTVTFDESDRPEGETQSLEDACDEADKEVGVSCKMV